MNLETVTSQAPLPHYRTKLQYCIETMEQDCQANCLRIAALSPCIEAFGGCAVARQVSKSGHLWQRKN